MDLTLHVATFEYLIPQDYQIEHEDDDQIRKICSLIASEFMFDQSSLLKVRLLGDKIMLCNSAKAHFLILKLEYVFICCFCFIFVIIGIEISNRFTNSTKRIGR